MEWLSLEAVPSPPGPRLSRTEAVVLSAAVHLFLFLFLIYAPDRLPESILKFLGVGHAASSARSATAADRATSEAEKEKAEREKRAKESRIPLKFAYVRVPDDAQSVKNPEAPLLSDKDRRARQEVKTPPDASRFTRDPHAEGNSRDRIRIDPSRPEGPDALDPVPPPAGARRGDSGSAVRKAPGPLDSANPGAEPRMTQSTGPGARLPERPKEETPGQAGESSGPPSDHDREGSSQDEREGPPGDASRPSQPDVKGGTEYKFSYSNPGWLRGQALGTLSFDTQGFPWGDYARRLYVIIRNNWLARIPLAAREGIAGYTCQHFVIARGGEISDIEIVRSSSIPPFNKAAGDALRASSPLPPLPEEFPDPREGVTFCFYYNMYPGEAD